MSTGRFAGIGCVATLVNVVTASASRPERVRERQEREQDVRAILGIGDVRSKRLVGVVTVLSDFVNHAVVVGGMGFVIERSRNCYKQLAERVARDSVSMVVEMFGITTVGREDVWAAGMPVREPAPGTDYGTFYRMTFVQMDRMQAVWALLVREVEAGRCPDAVAAPMSGVTVANRFAEPLEVHRVGVQRFVRCPHHKDGCERTPSAHLLNRMEDGSGVVYCFACRRTIGLWQDADGGGVWYRPFVSTGMEVTGVRSVRKASGRVVRAGVGEVAGVVSVVDVGGSGGVRVDAAVEAAPVVARLGERPRNAFEMKADHLERMRRAPQVGMSDAVNGVSFSPRPMGLIVAQGSGASMRRKYATHVDFISQMRSVWRRWKRVAYDAERVVALEADLDMRVNPVLAGRDNGYVRMTDREVMDLKKELMPNNYLGLHWMKHTEVRETNPSKSGVVLRFPARFEVCAGQWVLSDLDGFSAAPMGDAGLEGVGRELEAWASKHPMLSGRVTVVRTSHLGVQVAYELKKAREDMGEFYASEAGRALVGEMDDVTLGAVRGSEGGWVGGYADKAVHIPGGLCRLPGARIDKRGGVYVSRLVYCTGGVDVVRG